MKRALELVHLSHQHHRALVLARRIKKSAPGGDPTTKLLKDFTAIWNDELTPHFAEEELTIAPRLAAGGAALMAGRLLKEHDELRSLSARVFNGEPGALNQFGKLLYEHVRFEEREAFPYYERLIGAH